MDVKMPNLNGFETAALIYQRERLRHIPIIFITANNFDDENIFKGYQAGAVDYIYKPINQDVLRAKVSVFVELYEKTLKLREQEKSLIAANKNLEREIKERMASEEKVQKLNRQLLRNINHLESVNQELDRFAFMASHDLQEPLRKIRLFANKFILKNKANDKIVDLEDIDRIQKSAERMQLIIRDILTMAKVSTDSTEFVLTEINNLINEILAELEDEIKNAEAEIIADELPPLVVHPGLIKLLFRNLIVNSLKFRRKDIRPVIRIFCDNPSTKKRSLDGNHCRLLVKDNGLGFDPKFSDEIFGMFTRLVSEQKSEGTGLGLALCKKIAEHHKGSITAEGKPNDGATFILTLPLTTVITEGKTSQETANSAGFTDRSWPSFPGGS
jgi:light-regulated signal transduction histidine kinase (bacteriophytochrome)